MKKLAFSLLLLGCAATAHAQTSAGTVLLGGSVGYGSNKEESSSGQLAAERNWREFQFFPTAGYFVADNLALGLAGHFSSNKSEVSATRYDPAYGIYQSEYTSKSRGAAIGPFVRYYHMAGEKIGFYGQFAGRYQSHRLEEKSEVPFETTNSKSTGFGAFFTPGFVFFPTNKLGLELTMGNLGYSRNTTTQEATSQRQEQKITSSGFGAFFGLQNLALGASFYLAGK